MPNPVDLYSDSRFVSALPDTAINVYRGYMVQLESIARLFDSGIQNPWMVWNAHVRNLYVTMVIDAFEAHGVLMPEGMEIYFAGSLGKKQATEYSDLDVFVIFKDDSDKERCLPIFKALDCLFLRIFNDANQLYPDPIGINASRLSGTVDQLIETLKDGNLQLEPVIHSIQAARPIFGDYILGSKLKNRLSTDEELYGFCTAKHYYHLAINNFIAPDIKAEEINIKLHLLRPIDFIIAGLREEFGLSSEDGHTLNTEAVLTLLDNKGCIPKEQIDLIRSVYLKAMQTRFALHHQKKCEYDLVEHESFVETLAQVERLRILMTVRMQALSEVNLSQSLAASVCVLRAQQILLSKATESCDTTLTILETGMKVLDSIAEACKEGIIDRSTALKIMNYTVTLAEKPSMQKFLDFQSLVSQLQNNSAFSITFLGSLKLLIGHVCEYLGRVFMNEALERQGKEMIQAIQYRPSIKATISAAAAQFGLFTAFIDEASETQPLNIDRKIK